MKRAMERGAIIFGVMLAVGCQETRYVSCVPRRPDVEAASYKFNDPFPDDTIGPKTFSRPRDFDVPRTDTRKTFDYYHKVPEGPATGPQSQAYWNRGRRGTVIATQPPGTVAPIALDDNQFDTSTPRYNVVH